MMATFQRTANAIGRPGDGGDLDAAFGEPSRPMPVIDVEAAMENYRRVSYPNGDEDYDDHGETTKSVVSIPRVRPTQKG
jgi:hypothetical protein